MEDITLKPVKGIEDYARKQFGTHIIWYHRKGYYAQCMCAECGKIYAIRTKETGDPFEDDLTRIEVPARDRATKCRQCGTCTRTCPMNIDVAHTDFVRHPNCIGCLSCISSCPKGYLKYGLMPPRKKK